MFHRAGGKLFYIVVTIGFFVLSLQNTWAFLNKTLPDASWLFLVMMLVVFEGGFIGWLAMLMGGAENVWRVLIALVMMLITGSGVFVGAYYEIGGMMHQGIGYAVDPQVLAYVPKSVIFAYIATGVAIVLYGLASPEFFYRMSHMNHTGQAPAIGSRIEMLPPRYAQPQNTAQLAQGAQPLALPAPASVASTPQAKGAGVRNWFGNIFARGAAAFQNQPANEPAIVPENQPVEPDQNVQEIAQDEPVLVGAEAQYEVVSQRATPVHRKPKSGSKSKVATRRNPDDLAALLALLETSVPDITVARLAKMANCDESTVRRWRANKGQGGAK